MAHEYHTHKVAVIAYILKGDKFLLLKRNTEPYIWAPPGGRLKPDEAPVDGLKREIEEETNLEIEIVAPVNTWFGDWNGRPLLSIDFLVKVKGGELKLSSEHTDAVWVS
ncbi:MAG: NUDIX domain-containing protein, partial [Calditrichia bacterium]